MRAGCGLEEVKSHAWEFDYFFGRVIINLEEEMCHAVSDWLTM